MLAKLVDLITALPELIPLFNNLVNVITSGRTKEEKLDVAKRAVMSAAARRTFLESLPGK